MHIARPDTYKRLASTQQQCKIMHLLLHPIQTDASKGKSLITNYVHCPKAQA